VTPTRQTALGIIVHAPVLWARALTARPRATGHAASAAIAPVATTPRRGRLGGRGSARRSPTRRRWTSRSRSASRGGSRRPLPGTPRPRTGSSVVRSAGPSSPHGWPGAWTRAIRAGWSPRRIRAGAGTARSPRSSSPTGGRSGSTLIPRSGPASCSGSRQASRRGVGWPGHARAAFPRRNSARWRRRSLGGSEAGPWRRTGTKPGSGRGADRGTFPGPPHQRRRWWRDRRPAGWQGRSRPSVGNLGRRRCRVGLILRLGDSPLNRRRFPGRHDRAFFAFARGAP